MMAEQSAEELRGVFPRDGAWGHKILFDDFETRTIYGWLSPRLEAGDRFGYEMSSGRVAVFEAAAVDHQQDPSDMFFAEATDVGYADELGYDVSAGGSE